MKNKIVAFCISMIVTFSLFGLVYLAITYPEVVKAGVIGFVTLILIGTLYTFALGFLEGD